MGHSDENISVRNHGHCLKISCAVLHRSSSVVQSGLLHSVNAIKNTIKYNIIAADGDVVMRLTLSNNSQMKQFSCIFHNIPKQK